MEAGWHLMKFNLVLREKHAAKILEFVDRSAHREEDKELAQGLLDLAYQLAKQKDLNLLVKQTKRLNKRIDKHARRLERK
jgi:hypothetical protein